jgi:hypothetical protein
MMQQTLRALPSIKKRAKSVYSQRNLGTNYMGDMEHECAHRHWHALQKTLRSLPLHPKENDPSLRNGLAQDRVLPVGHAST